MNECCTPYQTVGASAFAGFCECNGVACPAEKGLAVANTVPWEVVCMIAAAWLMLSSLLYSLQLSTGSFPKPLSEEEERHYLALAKAGDLDARNVLIERNLRLVAHIMKKY